MQQHFFFLIFQLYFIWYGVNIWRGILGEAGVLGFVFFLAMAKGVWWFRSLCQRLFIGFSFAVYARTEAIIVSQTIRLSF